MARETSLKNSLDKAKCELNKLCHKARNTLDSSYDRISESGERITKATLTAVKKANSYVRHNPWNGIGISTVLGIIIGILISRR
ncbi:DUF883 family protein [Candidatus Pantoea carbekii]|uniref:Uncharacterized protein n=1 Tax=Candidatus Pantoea carbekii TaxID=1235990 RepID=U3U960_9GAMM|nr:DUF883 family protein [Candidatus Pantoea carbekii]AKC32540.1 inner membrane protein YqjD [Candidatus Pantoea carbekii]BAO00268.1 hypothetical protein HHS_02980 [Candidatus Pantoea carbekii]